MAYRDLREDETWDVLAAERVVRIAFHDGDSHYLLPLGYVLLGETLCGVTGCGRKTEMAKTRSSVALQVDTASATGLYEWKSVTGEGRFEIVTSGSRKRKTLLAMQPLMADAPEWWRREQEPRMASGEFEVWQVTPTEVHGRSFEPPAGEAS